MKIKIKTTAHDLSEKFAQHDGFAGRIIDIVVNVADREDVVNLEPKNIHRKLANHLTAFFRECGIKPGNTPEEFMHLLELRLQEADADISRHAAQLLTLYCKDVEQLPSPERGATGYSDARQVKLEYVPNIENLTDAWTLQIKAADTWSEPVVVSDAFGAVDIDMVRDHLV